MSQMVIDIGNSRIKSGLFEKDQLVGEYIFHTLEEALGFWKNTFFSKCILCSVSYSEKELRAKLPFDFIFLTHKTPIPLKNNYGTPGSLGLDRLAAALGAWHLSGGRPVLAIDLGTCITYELVDEKGTYLGGAISPGIKMRAMAMAHYTSKLPEITLSKNPKISIGNSTNSCMEVGIWLGVELELEGFISVYRQNFPEIIVYICGGDSQSFESLVKDHIFVIPNLVLYGLNCILNHNVE